MTGFGEAGAPWEGREAGQIHRALWQAAPGQAPLPVLTARGARPGPTVVVTGGVHGDEYEGPAAIHALFRTLDARGLAGTVIGLPVVHIAAWEAHARVSPEDGMDLNRIFPRRRAGASGALAAAVFETFVRPCDVLMDLHSGGAALVHLPLVGWYSASPEAEKLARGLDSRLHPWRIPDVPGVLSYEAHRAGRLAVAAEWGGGGGLDPAGVAALGAALARLLQRLEMLPPAPGESGPPDFDSRPAIAGDYQEALACGLFRASVRLGDRVAAGDPLGALDGLTGQGDTIVSAARAGIVAGLAHRPWVRPGDRIAYVG